MILNKNNEIEILKIPELSNKLNSNNSNQNYFTENENITHKIKADSDDDKLHVRNNKFNLLHSIIYTISKMNAYQVMTIFIKSFLILHT